MKQKAFKPLQAKAITKAKPDKKLSLSAGKKYAYKLIDVWAKEKQ